jgi:plasmid stabilization system protein ParE
MRVSATAVTIFDHPEIVPELSIENIRELLHRNYRIIYLVKKKTVEILTVFEGHQ